MSKMEHAVITDLLDIKGDKHPENIYTEDQINKVCKMLEDINNTPSKISESTGVSKDMIYQIRKGNTWTHISSKYNIRCKVINDKINIDKPDQIQSLNLVESSSTIDQLQ